MKKDLTESEALYELLYKKYNALDLTKVIYVQQLPDGSFSVKLGGKKINANELNNMRGEAGMIQKSRLWEAMKETLTNVAHQHMFTQMKTLEDAHYGKTLLYAISVFDTILQGISNPYVQKIPENLSKTKFQ